MMRVQLNLISTFLLILAALMACVDAEGHNHSHHHGGGDGDRDDEPLCVGVRGNGQYIWAHFTSYAQILESMGRPFDAMCGGSSATYSIFLTESMHKNPLVLYNKTHLEQATYLSFMMKSIETLTALDLTEAIIPPQSSIDALKSSILASSIPGVLDTVQANIKNNGGVITSINQTDPQVQQAIQDLIAIFNQWNVDQNQRMANTGLKIKAPLLNPQILELLLQSPVPHIHAQGIIDSLPKNELFTVKSQLAFIQPGLLNFQAVAELVDIVGSFYAGYDPLDLTAMDEILSQCAPPAFGKEWPEISKLTMTINNNNNSTDGETTTTTTTCGEAFQLLLETFMAARDPEVSPSRIQDPLGLFNDDGTASFTSIGQSSGIGKNDGIQLYLEALNSFQSTGNPNNNASWAADFDHIQFGYWGDEGMLAKVETHLKENYKKDLKSQKFRNLGQTTWNHVMLRSPAEPGVASAVPEGSASDDEFYAVGGWADLVPGQVLDSMGGICETIILVQQFGGAGPFQKQIATLLGATDEDMDAMFDLSDPDSGWSQALQAADGSICNNWNAYNASDIRGLLGDGWTSPMVSNDESIRSLFIGQEEEDNNIQLVGCTPLTITPDESTESPSPEPSSSSSSFRVSGGAIGLFVWSSYCLMISLLGVAFY